MLTNVLRTADMLGLSLLAGLALLSASPSRAAAPQTSTASVRALPLEEFLRLATARDTEFEAILLDRLSLAYAKDLVLPAGDLIAAARVQHHFFLDQGRSEPEAAVSLSKLFPRTGTRLSTGYSASPVASGGLKDSALDFTIAQDIAENAFGKAYRLRERIVGLEVEVARHQIVEAYEDYLAVLTSAYYDWYEAFESLKIGESALRAATRQHDDMLSRQRSRIALPIDVNKVRLQGLGKEEDVIALRERYLTRLQIIERAIRETLGPGATPVAPAIPAAPGEWTPDRRKDSRTYRLLDRLAARSTLNVELQAHELLPSLTALIGARMTGRDYGIRSRERLALAGIELSWPIPDVRARAESAVARIERDKINLVNENTRYLLDTRLRNLTLQIERELELIRVAEGRIQLADAVLVDETENYSRGRATLNEYIQAVNAVDSSRFNKIAHEVLLRQLILEYRRLTDSLVSEGDLATR